MDLVIRGNPVIMVLITVVGVAVMYFAVRLWRDDSEQKHARGSLLTGALSLLIGVVGQSFGLIQIINVVELAVDIPPALITEGIFNTFIPLGYGASWFVLASLIRYIKR